MSSILSSGGLMVLSKTTKTNSCRGARSEVSEQRVKAFPFPTMRRIAILLSTITKSNYDRRLYEQLVHD